MKTNVKGAMDRARVPHVAFVKHNLRAEVDKRIQEHIDEYEGKRREELEAYARALDETMIYTLHKELGGGIKRIRRFCTARDWRPVSSSVTERPATRSRRPARTLRTWVFGLS